ICLHEVSFGGWGFVQSGWVCDVPLNEYPQTLASTYLLAKKFVYEVPDKTRGALLLLALQVPALSLTLLTTHRTDKVRVRIGRNLFSTFGGGDDEACPRRRLIL